MVIVTNIHLRKKDCGVVSPLENDVLKILWKNPKGMRVRDIYNRLKRNRKIALTSVAVILDRLYKKQFAARKVHYGLGGGYYIYYPTLSHDDFQKSVIDETVNGIIEKFGPIAVNYFNERFSKKTRGSKNG